MRITYRTGQFAVGGVPRMALQAMRLLVGLVVWQSGDGAGPPAAQALAWALGKHRF